MARVVTNAALRELNLEGVPPGDERRLEVVANGLPLWHGAQVAVDATLVAPVRRNGTAAPFTNEEDGVALHRAARRKRRTYPEFEGAGRCQLVVFGIEVGGRWSQEAPDFIRLLARARGRAVPELVRRSAELAWRNRWSALIAVATQRALAASLLELPLEQAGCWDGEAPPLGEVLAEGREAVSLMPLRP